jgi:glycosyltransferase involved in cell wall biosynthesis
MSDDAYTSMTASSRTLVIQIPCFNEEMCLPYALRAIPRAINGFASIRVLVIDDNSTDSTIEVARSHGVTHIVALPEHVGLGGTFQAGIQASLALGADVIVNFDADNQYDARDIQRIVQPILDGRSRVVIGERDLRGVSFTKRLLHKTGNWFIRRISGLPVTDVTSGFRAIEREAARRIVIHAKYTYTLEMLLTIAFEDVPVSFVAIRHHTEVLRPSRLIRSNVDYIRKQAIIVLRCLLTYRPLALFGWSNLWLCGLSLWLWSPVWRVPMAVLALIAMFLGRRYERLRLTPTLVEER